MILQGRKIIRASKKGSGGGDIIVMCTRVFWEWEPFQKRHVAFVVE